MRRIVFLYLAAVAVPAPLLLAAPKAPAPTVDAKNWRAIARRVLPDKDDLLWQRIPWRASLWDAVVDANREEKPILLWAMNGHPLACT